MTIPTGGVSYYPFDEGSGTTLGDDWGSNDGTIDGPAWSSTVPTYGVSGSPDYSLSFDGSNDIIYRDSTTDFDFIHTDSFSYSFWFKTSETGFQPLFGKFDNTNSVGWDCAILNSKIITEFYSDIGNRIQVNATTTNISNNNYHNLVVTYDGSTDASGVNIYIDGSLESMTTTYDTLTASLSNSAKFTIGNRPGRAEYYQGFISNVQIFDTELTSTQVSNLYNYGNVDGAGTITYNPVFLGMNF